MPSRFFLLKRAAAGLISAALLAAAAPAAAETVLERINRTGELNAGTRADAIPFSFPQADGRLDGLSVDVLREIRAATERRLGKPIDLRLHTVTPANRIEKVRNSAVDLECGITTPTWDRETAVDFSIPFFGNGTRILAMRGTARAPEDFRGKRLGAVKGSTTTGILTTAAPGAQVIEVPDMAAGMAMLEKGELDGLSNLGIVLRAQVEGSALKSRVQLLPRTGAMSYESIACMLPKGDSEWRDLVNRAIADMLEGVDSYRGTFMRIHDRWLGPAGPVFYPLDHGVADRLAASVVWLK